MTHNSIDAIEILLWPHPCGLSAFAAPWVFDLEYDAQGNGTVDASFERLNVASYLRSIDRYRALDGLGRAQILKAALARRDDWRVSSSDFEHYLFGITRLA